MSQLSNKTSELLTQFEQKVFGKVDGVDPKKLDPFGQELKKTAPELRAAVYGADPEADVGVYDLYLLAKKNAVKENVSLAQAFEKACVENGFTETKIDELRKDQAELVKRREAWDKSRSGPHTGPFIAPANAAESPGEKRPGTPDGKEGDRDGKLTMKEKGQITARLMIESVPAEAGGTLQKFLRTPGLWGAMVIYAAAHSSKNKLVSSAVGLVDKSIGVAGGADAALQLVSGVTGVVAADTEAELKAPAASLAKAFLAYGPHLPLNGHVYGRIKNLHPLMKGVDKSLTATRVWKDAEELFDTP